MLESASGSFVVVGLDAPTRQFFWRGTRLFEVLSFVAHVDEDTHHVRLRVLNSVTYDAQYAEMVAAGIGVKKVAG
jgi:hypothetical protein